MKFSFPRERSLHSIASNHPYAFLLSIGKNLSTALLMPLLFVSFHAFSQSADIDQVRNGSATSPVNPADWVNGNAGPSNAHYAEGYSIPYRMKISGLVGNANTVHTLIIEWDTKDQNGHALDYITHYNNLDNPQGTHSSTFSHAAETVNPTLGTAFSGAPSLFQIPAPSATGAEITGMPATSFNNLPGAGYANYADATKMAIWGGTITAISYVSQDAPDATTASTKTRLSISFKSTNGSTALIAWGGHIAAEYDWGAGRGATAVSGSPYHTRLISLDGSGGNQDRSLKASAVIIPPPVCGISPAQFACPETDTLTFTAAGSSTGLNISYKWTLTNGSPSAGAKLVSDVGFTVKVVPTGTDFIAGGKFNLSLQVNKTGAQSTTCSLSPAGTIAKVVVGATATPNQLDLAVSNTSQLNTVLTGSDDVAAGNYTYSWTQSPPSGGSLSSATASNPVFTATAPGSYTFIVTATQKAAPNCSDTGKVVVNVSASTPPCNVAGPSPICPSSTASYFYDPNNNGTQNVSDSIPAHFTAGWRLENNTNGAVINGDTTGKSVSITASANCATSFRIRITLRSVSGLITTSCFKDVTVNDVTPPVITNCPADVTIECDAASDTAHTGSMTATDNCSVTVTYKDDVAPGCYTTITRTWTATDPCGNTAVCVQHIVKRDRTAPVINCPTTGDATATDNCSATQNIRIYSRDDGTTRTWTAIDESGNMSTCTQTIAAGKTAPVKEIPQAAPVKQAAVITKTEAAAKTSEARIKPAEIMAEPATLDVKAYPNPFTNEVTFRLSSPIAGKGSLETYDLVGRKLAIIFQGNVEANTPKLIKYTVPASYKVPMMYRFSVEKLTFGGLLLPNKR